MNPVQVTPELERYILSLLPKPDPALTRIEEHAEREGVPIVGPHEGRLLYVLVRLLGGRRILELGAATGYSGTWMLRAAGPGGELVTIEKDPKRARLARTNLADAAPDGKADVVEADVSEALARLEGPFDVCFNDLLNSFADESQVERAFSRSLELTRAGGLFMADNALRQGEVAAPRGQQARNVLHYNKLVAASPRLEGVIVPIRDGLNVAVVK